MLDIRVKTYRLTVSVPGDISQGCIGDVCSFLDKRCDSLYVVTEVSAKLHLHACVCLSIPPAFDQFKQWKYKLFKRIRDHHPDAKSMYALVVTTMYNHDWYDDYLKKDVQRTVYIDRYDRDVFSAAFPTKEEQERLESFNKKDPVPLFSRLAQAYMDSNPGKTDVTGGEVIIFIREQALSHQIVYPKDSRTLLWLTDQVYRALTNNTQPTRSEIATMKRMEMDRVDICDYDYLNPSTKDE